MQLTEVINKKTELSKGIDLLKSKLAKDPEFAWSWHCNIATPIQDSGISHKKANIAAARVMQHLFGVDTSSMKQYNDIIDN